MSEPIIRVERLGKRYRIGLPDQRPESWREALAGGLLSPFRYLRQMARPPTAAETLWALRDVSFEVAPGEAVGIVGRNGAGKSTLLKILSRITEPTEGRAILKGRVGSLLEVGTGFHPELTGRENVYLNGTILGMRKREVDRKFDEIVAFAGVEQMIDTPVKRYSSGMAVRLAFAVAAHLEPEILVVDEVLAVGDLEFQRKCLGKMEAIGRQGRTVLFVSHNLVAVTGLCRRALLLDGGRVAAVGSAEEVVAQYIQSGLRHIPEVIWEPEAAPANDVARLLSVRVQTEQGQTAPVFDIRRPIALRVEYEVLRPGIWFTPNIQVKNEANIVVFNSNEEMDPNWAEAFPETGRYQSICWIPGNFLAEGAFTVRVVLWGFTRPAHKGVLVEDAVQFHVADELKGDSVRGQHTGSFPGIVRPKLNWTRQRLAVERSN